MENGETGENGETASAWDAFGPSRWRVAPQQPSPTWPSDADRSHEDEAGEAARRDAARVAAIAAVLSAVSERRFVHDLVLRGSMLMKLWFGDAAREPGDLDFVTIPAEVPRARGTSKARFQAEVPRARGTSASRFPVSRARGTSDARYLATEGGPRGWRTDELLDALATEAESAAREAGAVAIDASGAERDELWTYDRAPGRRLVLPWSTPDGGLTGTLQLDFSFGEPLPAPPEQIAVRRAGRAPALLLAASPELSLVWKLLWLMTDDCPRGKDLYDAALLAEVVPLPRDLLMDVFRAARHRTVVDLGSFRRAVERVDWGSLLADDPTWKLDLDDTDRLGARLVAALAPHLAV